MTEAGDQMYRVLLRLRDNELSITDARSRIEQIADAARARYTEGSDDWVPVEIDEGMYQELTPI